MNKPLVSILIVNWNTCKLTCDCIRSVIDQTRCDYEIIVVDNASTDDSIEQIRLQFKDVTLIANEANIGFAAANNEAMKAAKGQYLLLLNSDTVVLDGAIDKTIEFADKNPDAAVVGCKAINSDMSLQCNCFMFPSLLNMFLMSTYLYKVFDRSRFFGRERMSYWNYDTVRQVDVVTGCFMLVRREAIEEVGAMDERFFMYAEETDWCYRFKQAGYKVLYTPVPSIIHFGGQSSKKVSQMALQVHASVLFFIRKHKGRLQYAVACLLTSLFFIVRLPVWGGIWLLKRTDAAAQKTKLYARGALAALAGVDALSIKGNK